MILCCFSLCFLFGCGNNKKETISNDINLCEVDECSEDGINEIIGISGKTEYYCDKHYKSLKDMDNSINIYVNDWTLDNYLSTSFKNHITIKKEITVSNEKNYFALASFGGSIRIVPILDGKGKIIEEINKKYDSPSKFKIGALFEMETPDDNGLEISLENVKNDIKKKMSRCLQK